MPAGRGATTTHCQSHFGLLQQGALPQPAEEPFLPFHSISDHTLAHFSPKNVFVQILVRNGDFFVWENDQKKPPPTRSTHTAIISPRLNMAAAAGQPCFSGQGLPAVRGCRWIKSVNCSGLFAAESLPAIHAVKSLPAVHISFTKSLSAVHIYSSLSVF